MKIVVNNKKEHDLLAKLQDFLAKKELNFFLEFEDPFSFKIEELFLELCSCDIEIDKKEDKTDIV